MILYKLSFLKYLKEKLKEILSLSGRCKGDIFLNPALKAGKDILREYYHDDHILHAIRYFAAYDGYADCYYDLNAGFGATATEVASEFRQSCLYEKDPLLGSVLKVNMTLKVPQGHWKIFTEPSYPGEKAIVRCESGKDLAKMLARDQQVIIFQNKAAAKISAPHHNIYHYTACMDRNRPIRTLWGLLTKGYVFKLNNFDEADGLSIGDYIFLPKGLALVADKSAYTVS